MINLLKPFLVLNIILSPIIGLLFGDFFIPDKIIALDNFFFDIYLPTAIGSMVVSIISILIYYAKFKVLNQETVFNILVYPSIVSIFLSPVTIPFFGTILFYVSSKF